MKDLVLLVADKNMHFALKGALSRPEALGIRPIEFEFRVHPGRDGGARRSGPETLALERRRFRHGLLVLDFEGSGSEAVDAKALEEELDARLSKLWQDAAKAIVIEPELDVWIWGADNAVESVIVSPARRQGLNGLNKQCAHDLIGEIKHEYAWSGAFSGFPELNPPARFATSE